MKLMIIDKINLKRELEGVLFVHGCLKVNEMNTHRLTWIFTGKN